MNAAKQASVLPGLHRPHPQADWLIGPCGVHRDSDTVERSNWETMCALYLETDPEGLDHEIHRFGHWAVGWVEECVYRPGSLVAIEADKLRARLDEYPILNEDHHSMLEHDGLDS